MRKGPGGGGQVRSLSSYVHSRAATEHTSNVSFSLFARDDRCLDFGEGGTMYPSGQSWMHLFQPVTTCNCLSVSQSTLPASCRPADWIVGTYVGVVYIYTSSSVWIPAEFCADYTSNRPGKKRAHCQYHLIHSQPAPLLRVLIVGEVSGIGQGRAGAPYWVRLGVVRFVSLGFGVTISRLVSSRFFSNVVCVIAKGGVCCRSKEIEGGRKWRVRRFVDWCPFKEGSGEIGGGRLRPLIYCCWG